MSSAITKAILGAAVILGAVTLHAKEAEAKKVETFKFNPKTASIVCPADNPKVIEAAKKLQAKLKEQTGVEMPVGHAVPRYDEGPAFCFFVGIATPGDSAIGFKKGQARIWSTYQGVWIYGNDKDVDANKPCGSLIAVDRFIDDQVSQMTPDKPILTFGVTDIR